MRERKRARVGARKREKVGKRKEGRRAWERARE